MRKILKFILSFIESLFGIKEKQSGKPVVGTEPATNAEPELSSGTTESQVEGNDKCPDYTICSSTINLENKIIVKFTAKNL